MAQKPLTPKQLASLCHVSQRTILNWIEEEKIVSFTTPGGHHRIEPKVCIEFLKKYNFPIPPEIQTQDKKIKILIVDDEVNIIRLIKRLLRKEKKYLIEEAHDGFDAGRKLLSFFPDLVLLDIRMPGMDGYEVVRRIKDMPECEEIKIIAMSAFFEEEGKNKIKKIGVNACIDKPFKNTELITMIGKVMGTETRYKIRG